MKKYTQKLKEIKLNPIHFILAFLVAFSVTPVVKKFAFKIGAVDIPKDNRRMHKNPIATMGGLAIIIGFFVSMMFNIIGTILNISTLILDKQILGLLIGIVLIVGIGIVLSQTIKFINVIAASLLASVLFFVLVHYISFQ